jgi:hypothetical protein
LALRGEVRALRASVESGSRIALAWLHERLWPTFAVRRRAGKSHQIGVFGTAGGAAWVSPDSGLGSGSLAP